MRTLLKPIVILPALIGIITCFFVFQRVWEKRKQHQTVQATAVPGAALPKGMMINLQTEQDDYEKLTKGKVLLVFLTSNCNACKKDIPNISQALPSLASKVAVYGVCLEERSVVQNFVQENQIEFPILLDSGGRVFASLGKAYVPAKILIENGTITKTWFGSSPNKSAFIRDVGEVE